MVDFRARAQRFGQTIAYPNPRPALEGARIDWPKFQFIFPSVTHLYLPGLLLPDKTSVNIAAPYQLVKLSLGRGGPPVPTAALRALILSHCQSLKAIHLGHLLPSGTREYSEAFGWLGQQLANCDLEDFCFECSPNGSMDPRCDLTMPKYSDLVYVDALRGRWRKSLKVLISNSSGQSVQLIFT